MWGQLINFDIMQIKSELINSRNNQVRVGGVEIMGVLVDTLQNSSSFARIKSYKFNLSTFIIKQHTDLPSSQGKVQF